MRSSSWCIASDIPSLLLSFAISAGGEDAGVSCWGDGAALAMAEEVISRVESLNDEIRGTTTPELQAVSVLVPGTRTWRAVHSSAE
jgi:hypothetical protein